MMCACGHSDDVHEKIADPDEASSKLAIGSCEVCSCDDFIEEEE